MEIFDSVRDGRFGDAPQLPVPLRPTRVQYVNVVLGVEALYTRFADDARNNGKGEYVADINQNLQIIKSSTIPFDIIFNDPNGELADLTGATAASLIVVSDLGSSPVELISIRTTDVDPMIALDIANSKVTISLDQDTADGLKTGKWIGQVCVKIDDLLKYSKNFYVQVAPAVAPAL